RGARRCRRLVERELTLAVLRRVRRESLAIAPVRSDECEQRLHLTSLLPRQFAYCPKIHRRLIRDADNSAAVCGTGQRTLAGARITGRSLVGLAEWVEHVLIHLAEKGTVRFNRAATDSPGSEQHCGGARGDEREERRDQHDRPDAPARADGWCCFGGRGR